MRIASLRRPTLTRRATLATGGAAALAAATSRTRAADTSVIRVAFPAAIATLDPAKMRVGGLDYNYAHCVFSRLTTQNNKLEVLPDLATKWEATEDLKTWTFHLRPGVKFHNGKTLDAADVVFTYNRLLDPSIGSVLRASLSAISKVEAVDSLTVKFSLSIPYTDIPAVTAGYQAMIVSESTVDTLPTKPIGTGPFRFVEYRPGDQMVLEKNPDYFLPGLPKMDRADMQDHSGIHHRGRRAGERRDRHRLRPAAGATGHLKNSHVSRVEEVPSGHWQGIVFNDAFKPFDDPRVRRGLHQADRQAGLHRHRHVRSRHCRRCRRSRRRIPISARTCWRPPTSQAPKKLLAEAGSRQRVLAGDVSSRAARRHGTDRRRPSATWRSR